LFIYKLRAVLDYSNHKQFFLFKAFASITSAPPLRKILAAPLHLMYRSCERGAHFLRFYSSCE